MAFELPYEVNPGENIEAPVKTNILLAYSNSHLYMVFQAFDPEPEKIRARHRDRDDIWSDEKLFSQVLFSYKLTPQTILFLGYSDGYEDMVSTTENENVPILDNKRNWLVFSKIGYAFVLS